KGGGTCAYLRHLTAAGAATDGAAVTCQNTAANGATMGQVTGTDAGGPSTSATMTIGGTGGDSPLSVQQQAAGRGLVAYRQAPRRAATVILTDAAGRATKAVPAADGWFIVTLPAGT